MQTTYQQIASLIINQSKVLVNSQSNDEAKLLFAKEVWGGLSDFFKEAKSFKTSWVGYETLVNKTYSNYMFFEEWSNTSQGDSYNKLVKAFITDNIVNLFNIALTMMVGNKRNTYNKKLIELLDAYNINGSIMEKIRPESFVLIIKRVSGVSSESMNRYYSKISGILTKATFKNKTKEEVSKAEKSLHFLRKLLITELKETLAKQ